MIWNWNWEGIWNKTNKKRSKHFFHIWDFFSSFKPLWGSEALGDMECGIVTDGSKHGQNIPSCCIKNQQELEMYFFSISNIFSCFSFKNCLPFSNFSFNSVSGSKKFQQCVAERGLANEDSLNHMDMIRVKMKSSRN